MAATDVSAASATETDTGSAGVDEFLIAHGGPFYVLQQRLGLIHERALNAGRRAALLVGLAWGVLLLLSALSGHAIGPVAARPFLLDLGAWARFFIAIAIFVLMERMVEERLRAHLRHFARAPLIAPAAMPAAAEAVVRALRRRDAWLAELFCGVAAYAITLGGAELLVSGAASSWIVTMGPEGARLTPAGWWCALVSSPLFWFLLLRWLWRHAVWGLLLRDLARLELRLVATHPDGAGGVAFIGQYPNAFAAFVFALSCVLGAALAQTLLRSGLTAAAYGQLMVAWLIVVMILFGAPLLAFTKPLKRLKEATLLTAASIATRRERAVERELLGKNMAAPEDADATAATEIPEPSKLYAAAKKLSTFLISRSAILPVAAAALLPLVGAGATQLPFRELLKIARSVVAMSRSKGRRTKLEVAAHLVAALAIVTPAAVGAAEDLCQGYAGIPEDDGPQTGMVWIEGGAFTMGDDDERPEESAAHEVTLEGFWIDRHEVTNAQFARFVEATGYVTLAERGLDPADHPGMPPELLAPGAVVFTPPDGLLNLVDFRQWWRYTPGAEWRHPSGPGSSIEGRDNHPVVNIAYEDAQAYARWLGRELPTEAQWEFAARGGREGATYSWGDAYYDPVAGWQANTWQGLFPLEDDADDGYRGAAPVGCFAPNGYGLFDMAGNVWEYARDWYLPGHPPESATDPHGPDLALAARHAGPTGPSVVIKGGSYLCAPNFCARYRPAARQPQELGLGASHLGFRTVLNAKG